jgi:hypothetical protein
VFAQSFGGGLIGGVTFSQLLGTDIYGFQKVGMVGGVYANRRIKEKSAVQLEMVFVQKGLRKVTKIPNGGGTTFVNRNLNYIEVPLLFKSKLKGRFDFELGLSGAVLLSTRFRTENGEGDIYDANQQPFNRFEFGCLGGFNFKVSDSFDLNFRYLNSIIRVRKHQAGQTQMFGGLRLNRGEYNSVLQLSLRYKFNGNKAE